MHLLAGINGVTRGKRASVDQTHDIARIGGIHGIARATKDSQGVLGGKAAAGLGVVDLHAALEFTGNHAHKGQVIAVLLVHACLDLEDDAREVIANLADLINGAGGSLNRLRIGVARVRSRGNGAQGVQNLVHTKVQHRRSEDEWGGHALLKKFLVM